MPLNQKDQEYIQNIFERGITQLKDLFNEKTINITDKQDATIAQTTKTNGTVIKHTDQITALIIEQSRIVTLLTESLTHPNCSQNMKMDSLWEKHITEKGVGKWKDRLGTFMVAALSSLLTAFLIFEFILNYTPK